MEEIKQMHDVNIEWGCITNLMDKISDIEDEIDGGWPELVDMVADAITEEGNNKDPVSAFFNLYQFLWRLYYRIKTNKVKQPFNQYSKVGEQYWIKNYSFAILKWANRLGLNTEIDNLTIKISADKLTDRQRREFDKRCK